MHTKFKTGLKYSCLIFNIRYSTVNTVTKSCTSIKQRYSFARKLLRKQMLYSCVHHKMNDFDLTIPIMPLLCGSKKQTGHNIFLSLQKSSLLVNHLITVLLNEELFISFFIIVAIIAYYEYILHYLLRDLPYFLPQPYF